MVDHGGRVTTIEVNMEMDPLHWIQCIIAVTMGPFASTSMLIPNVGGNGIPQMTPRYPAVIKQLPS